MPYLGGTDDYVPLKPKSKKKENIKDGPRLTREEDEEDFDENGKIIITQLRCLWILWGETCRKLRFYLSSNFKHTSIVHAPH